MASLSSRRWAPRRAASGSAGDGRISGDLYKISGWQVAADANVSGIVGKAEFQTTGPHFDAIRAKFRWARAALVINVEEAKPQL
jgi:hypothetical protein